jgi:hypothetical protein
MDLQPPAGSPLQGRDVPGLRPRPGPGRARRGRRPYRAACCHDDRSPLRDASSRWMTLCAVKPGASRPFPRFPKGHLGETAEAHPEGSHPIVVWGGSRSTRRVSGWPLGEPRKGEGRLWPGPPPFLSRHDKNAGRNAARRRPSCSPASTPPTPPGHGKTPRARSHAVPRGARAWAVGHRGGPTPLGVGGGARGAPSLGMSISSGPFDLHSVAASVGAAAPDVAMLLMEVDRARLIATDRPPTSRLEIWGPRPG